MWFIRGWKTAPGFVYAKTTSHLMLVPEKKIARIGVVRCVIWIYITMLVMQFLHRTKRIITIYCIKVINILYIANVFCFPRGCYCVGIRYKIFWKPSFLLRRIDLLAKSASSECDSNWRLKKLCNYVQHWSILEY